jgi:hypothetical protein
MNVRSECPYCGEPLEMAVDERGGRRQAYVEDCVVCCRPIEVEVVVEGGGVELTLRSQDD